MSWLPANRSASTVDVRFALAATLTALLLEVAAWFYLRASPKAGASAGLVAAVVATSFVLVGLGVTGLYVTVRAQRVALSARVNGGFAELAQQLGLHVQAQPPGASGEDAPFVEVRGVLYGLPVRVAVVPRNTDELGTMLEFTGATPALVGRARARTNLYDELETEGDRLRLFLGRRLPWAERARDLLFYDRLPEWDAQRLRVALQMIVDVPQPSPSGP